MADIVLFPGGLTIPESKFEDADRIVTLIFYEMYKSETNEEPPGWPSAASKKDLFEWYIKRSLNRLAKSAKKLEYEQAYSDPEDIVD